MPLIVYADFETYQSKDQSTSIVSRMTGVASYGYKIVSSVPSIPSELVVKLGTADDFVKEMQELGFRCLRPLKDVVPLNRSTVTGTPKVCYACGKRFSKKFAVDHDHFTGAFRGYACHRCNIKMQNPREFVVDMHNAEGFDNHFVIPAIARLRKQAADLDEELPNWESLDEEPGEDTDSDLECLNRMKNLVHTVVASH